MLPVVVNSNYPIVGPNNTLNYFRFLVISQWRAAKELYKEVMNLVYLGLVMFIYTFLVTSLFIQCHLISLFCVHVHI